MLCLHLIAVITVETLKYYHTISLAW